MDPTGTNSDPLDPGTAISIEMEITPRTMTILNPSSSSSHLVDSHNNQHAGSNGMDVGVDDESGSSRPSMQLFLPEQDSNGHNDNSVLAPEQSGSTAKTAKSPSGTGGGGAGSRAHKNGPNKNSRSKKYYAMEIDQLSTQFGVFDLSAGLTSQEAASRLHTHGHNVLKGGKRVNPLVLLLRHSISLINLVLFGAFILCMITQDFVEGGVIILMVVANIIVGFIQDYRSEKTLESLKKLSAPMAVVRRDGGTLVSISSREIVPGDIVFLSEGDYVPADLRLFEAVNLEIDEALITGESVPAVKRSHTLATESSEGMLALGDQDNMAFMTTIVTKGRGFGITVATGMHTEIGNIAASLKAAQKGSSKGKGRTKKLTLQRRMDLLGIALLFASIFLGFLVFASQRFNFLDKDIWLYVISIAVAIVPECLIAVLAATLALGVAKMAKRKSVVRKMSALDTLATITNICSDKTGTLTEGKMVVTQMWIACGKSFEVTGRGITPAGELLFNGKPFQMPPSRPCCLTTLIVGGALCNSSSLQMKEQEWIGSGDPTEIALLVLAEKLQFGRPFLMDGGGFEFVAEHPFDNVLKRMTTIYSRPFQFHGEDELKSQKLQLPSTDELAESAPRPAAYGSPAFLAEVQAHSPPNAIDAHMLSPEDVAKEYYVFMKGATESVYSCCTHVLAEDLRIVPLQPDYFQTVLSPAMIKIASQGLRVLAIAYRTISSRVRNNSREEIENNMVFAGLIGMYDPPREETRNAIAMCAKAKINVHMVTGDHPQTALAIARQVGIVSDVDADEPGIVMIGADIDAMTLADIDLLPRIPRVVARCNPKTKVKLVTALHRRGKYVIMTGDGVNDAPAIKYADVGVAMGKNGTEVAKQAADVVIQDDNFFTIVTAIEEGRRIFNNISNIIIYLMTSNVAEVIVFLMGIILGVIEKRTVYPLSANQVLWINLMTDMPPALGIGLEPVHKSVMSQRPRKPHEGLFRFEVVSDMLYYGGVMGSLAVLNFLLMYYWLGDYKTLLPDGTPESIFQARAVAFSTITFGMLIHGYNCRHNRESVAKMSPFKNWWVIGAIVLGILTSVPLFYIPYVNRNVFKMEMMLGYEWLLTIISMLVFEAMIEFYKLGKRGVVKWLKLRKLSRERVDKYMRMLEKMKRELKEELKAELREELRSELKSDISVSTGQIQAAGTTGNIEGETGPRPSLEVTRQSLEINAFRSFHG